MVDDLISRQAAIECVSYDVEHTIKCLKNLPSIQKSYTKADYIMCLHKQYGCDLIKAEKAHEKALQYLRDNMMIKG